MGIKIQHGSPGAQLSAAAAIGQQKRQEEKQLRQEQIAFQASLRQQDLALDLEKFGRAKLWEIEKMELASRLDFERTERVRQRKLDGIDNSLAQIDKEVRAGRMSEKEAYPLRLTLELNKEGVDVSTKLLPQNAIKQFGIPPYWMKGEEAEMGTPSRQLYEAKMGEAIQGRTGTTPYHESPEFVRNTPPEVLKEIWYSEGMDFSDTQFEAYRNAILQEDKQVQPTQEELRKQGTKEAYEQGKSLGYWE